MSSVLSEAAAPTAAAPPQTAGAWLREARQQRGLHIAALAAMLKVPQAKLEALETDRWKDLPDATFARALAKAMCRVLKVDAAPALALMPRNSGADLDVSRGLNQPYRERGGRDEGVSLASLLRPVVWGPVVLVLGAALVYTMPASWLAGVAGQTPPEAVVTPIPLSAPVLGETAASEPVAATPTLLADDAATVASTATQTATATAAATATAVGVGVAPAASVAVPVPAPGSVPLTVKVTAESWVEIVDARGQLQLSKLLRPGDVVDLAVLPPLKVRVGNVAATAMLLRGSAVDLAGSSKDNVARLELN